MGSDAEQDFGNGAAGKNDSPDIAAYRELLINTEQRVSEQLDKIIITVASGSLAISLVFMKDVVGDGPIRGNIFLIISWACLTACLILTLVSFYVGLLAYRKAQNQVDDKTINHETPGGCFSKVLSISNSAGILLLCVGLIMLFTFAYKNLPMEMQNGKKTIATTETNPNPAGTAPSTTAGQAGGCPSAATASSSKVDGKVDP